MLLQYIYFLFSLQVIAKSFWVHFYAWMLNFVSERSRNWHVKGSGFGVERKRNFTEISLVFEVSLISPFGRPETYMQGNLS